MSKVTACCAGDAGDAGSTPGWGRSPGGGHGNPLQYSCLENPVDRGAWGGAGWGSTVQGHKELDMTEATERAYTHPGLRGCEGTHFPDPPVKLWLHSCDDVTS